jgi:CheY-like chemotaxis protein
VITDDGHLLEPLALVCRLSEARWVALAWQGDDGVWRHALRGRGEMVPQAQTRIFETLEICAAEGGEASSKWSELLVEWRVSDGFFQAFDLGHGRPAYYATVGVTPNAVARDWIDLVLRHLAVVADCRHQLQTHGAQRQAVLESAATLSAAGGDHEVLAHGVDLARRLLGAEGAAYYEWDSSREHYTLRHSESELGAPSLFVAALQGDDRICRGAVSTAHPQVVRVRPAEPRGGPEVAMLVGPITEGRSVKGLLCLVRDRGATFGDFDISTLALFCRQLAGVRENRRLLERLQHANRELSQTQAQLVESARLETLGEVAGTVAHDFNNVLGALLGRVQLLQYSLAEPSILGALGKMERMITDGAATVTRLQEAAHVRREPQARSQKLVEILRDVVAAAEESVRAQTQIHDRRVEWRADLKPTALVLEGAERLEAVLLQLVSELQASVPNHSTVELRTFREEDRDVLQITLIPCTEAEAADWHWNGLGAMPGLSAIADQLAARLEIDRATAGQSRLTLRFGSAVPKPVPAEADRKYRVLIVDDDHDVREVLEELLCADGHTVTVAEDGAAALQLFDPEAFDLVFTDLGMPGISGWQVARQVKRAAPDLPVVMITGWGAQLDPEQIAESGVDEVLSKPFQWLAVLDIMKKLAGSRGVPRTAL